MAFKILYVEHNKKNASDVMNAVEEANLLRKTARTIQVFVISTPDDLEGELENKYDLVLADVFFPERKDRDHDKLDSIISAVSRWHASHPQERPIPIIAYTGEGKQALDSCLRRKGSLYDIWDKTTARPPYVAWRFSQLALELARERPDALLQRRIREMTTGASWHDYVIDMALRYDASWTELDQIERVGSAIENIAHRLGTFDFCHRGWQVMTDWEGIGRSVSRRTRGHSRHVVNVFWLGYFLIHHPVLHPWFVQAWRDLLMNRSGMKAISEVPATEALSTAWFYAALLHDVAGCVEKSNSATSKIFEIMRFFNTYIDTSDRQSSITERGKQDAEKLFHDLGGKLQSELYPLWESSVASKKPDHGVVAAIRTTQGTSDQPEQLALAREAARAMIVHNLIGQLHDSPSTLLDWDNEPLACLLLLCDQIQTWDRERGDRTLKDGDEPERAELSSLEVFTAQQTKPTVKIGIDYIAPRHLNQARDRFTRMKDTLDFILKDKPNRALARIGKWPFELRVDCWLNDEPLDTPMHFK